MSEIIFAQPNDKDKQSGSWSDQTERIHNIRVRWPSTNVRCHFLTLNAILILEWRQREIGWVDLPCRSRLHERFSRKIA